MSQTANLAWLSALAVVTNEYEYTPNPRDMKVREVLNYNYTVSMSEPVVTHSGRRLNYKFMFGEAAWILRGRNDLATIQKYMKSYGRFSDDGASLNGAYGPKIMDQIAWAAKELLSDPDSRRCYINIWRERPGPSKDIPCTTGIQFIIRNGTLHCFVNMRSQDVVWGMPYDIFVFTAIANYLRMYLWHVHSHGFSLGNLHVRAASMHIYERHFDDAQAWITTRKWHDEQGEDHWQRCFESPDLESYLSCLETAEVDHGNH